MLWYAPFSPRGAEVLAAFRPGKNSWLTSIFTFSYRQKATFSETCFVIPFAGFFGSKMYPPFIARCS